MACETLSKTLAGLRQRTTTFVPSQAFRETTVLLAIPRTRTSATCPAASTILVVKETSSAIVPLAMIAVTQFRLVVRRASGATYSLGKT